MRTDDLFNSEFFIKKSQRKNQNDEHKSRTICRVAKP